MIVSCFVRLISHLGGIGNMFGYQWDGPGIHLQHFQDSFGSFGDHDDHVDRKPQPKIMSDFIFSSWELGLQSNYRYKIDP